MGRSDGVIVDLGQEIWYSKRIRAGGIGLIRHEPERWFSDWTWAVVVMNGLNFDKIGETLTYTWKDRCMVY